jgi:hypothetical protein
MEVIDLKRVNRYRNHQDVSEIRIRSGLDPELDGLGFAKNSSPMLEAKVARAVAFDPCPFEVAQHELVANSLNLGL